MLKDHRVYIDNTVKDRVFTQEKGKQSRLTETSLPSQIMCAKTNNPIDGVCARMVEREIGLTGGSRKL